MVYKTLVFTQFTILFIQAIALMVSWRQNPHEPGLRDWGIAELLMAVGSLMLVAGIVMSRDMAPLEVPMLIVFFRDFGVAVANTGWFMAWVGMRRFYHKPAPGLQYIFLFMATFFLILIPGYHLPGWRVVPTSFSISIFAAIIIGLLYRSSEERSFATHMGAISMLLVCVTWFIRGVYSLADLERSIGDAMIDIVCTYSSIVMSTVFTFALILLTNERIHNKLKDQASIDSLTGALNRRAFFEASQMIVANNKRMPSELVIVVIDLDFFKQINDRYGHAVGDEVLVEFSNQMREDLREGDLFARYGGEEFVILFQNSDFLQARQAIERLREQWSSRALKIDDHRVEVSFSAGIVSAKAGEPVNIEDMLNRADKLLYQAKRGGRNKIYHEATESPRAVAE